MWVPSFFLFFPRLFLVFIYNLDIRTHDHGGGFATACEVLPAPKPAEESSAANRAAALRAAGTKASGGGFGC
jgi:hypothetical protein